MMLLGIGSKVRHDGVDHKVVSIRKFPCGDYYVVLDDGQRINCSVVEKWFTKK